MTNERSYATVVQKRGGVTISATFFKNAAPNNTMIFLLMFSVQNFYFQCVKTIFIRINMRTQTVANNSHIK